MTRCDIKNCRKKGERHCDDCLSDLCNDHAQYIGIYNEESYCKICYSKRIDDDSIIISKIIAKLISDAFKYSTTIIFDDKTNFVVEKTHESLVRHKCHIVSTTSICIDIATTPPEIRDVNNNITVNLANPDYKKDFYKSLIKMYTSIRESYETRVKNAQNFIDILKSEL